MQVEQVFESEVLVQLECTRMVAHEQICREALVPIAPVLEVLDVGLADAQGSVIHWFVSIQFFLQLLSELSSPPKLR
jgi:hypothetical protein